ncbi:hypothetical protein [Aquimarina sediminis]|uniref:hypothetical protein n=1 Tax=Aquimarina sediminis TaxID=2070536 RepID=UPI000FFF0CDA|nr:hypothetical protein [Aquimarina sediminis]
MKNQTLHIIFEADQVITINMSKFLSFSLSLINVKLHFKYRYNYNSMNSIGSYVEDFGRTLQFGTINKR